MKTICDRCGLVLTDEKGRRLHSANFDSAIRHRHANNYHTSTIYALCDRCYQTMSDPTYDPRKIALNPVWDLAFTLSEIRNDNAPIGWGTYIATVECLLAHYHITRKPKEPKQ